MTAAMSAVERRELLKQVYLDAKGCTRCPLAETRTTVVFGAGNADADLMFVGEAPGANEDRQGLPFVGQAGRLLDRLLQEIGLSRDQVFIANVLKCRPPGNRDPRPTEIESCRAWLDRQVELIQPRVICTLGNFATKLLRDDPTGISRLHGRAEVRVLGRRAVRIYPLYHPAAALYTPSMVETLRADFQRLPALLAEPAPEQPPPLEEVPVPLEEVAEALAAEAAAAADGGAATAAAGATAGGAAGASAAAGPTAAAAGEPGDPADGAPATEDAPAPPHGGQLGLF